MADPALQQYVDYHWQLKDFVKLEGDLTQPPIQIQIPSTATFVNEKYQFLLVYLHITHLRILSNGQRAGFTKYYLQQKFNDLYPRVAS